MNLDLSTRINLLLSISVSYEEPEYMTVKARCSNQVDPDLVDHKRGFWNAPEVDRNCGNISQKYPEVVSTYSVYKCLSGITVPAQSPSDP